MSKVDTDPNAIVALSGVPKTKSGTHEIINPDGSHYGTEHEGIELTNEDDTSGMRALIDQVKKDKTVVDVVATDVKKNKPLSTYCNFRSCLLQYPCPKKVCYS